MIEPHREPEVGREPARVLWAPPSYDAFDDADLTRFRLLLDQRGWCVGLVWFAYGAGERASKAGVTWNVSSQVKNTIWAYLSQCAHEGVDAANAYQAVVADTRGAYWSREFNTFGHGLNQARLWMQGSSSDEVAGWAGGVALPSRASRWAWANPAEFSFQVATRPGESASMLLALGDEMLLRDERQWWVVPPKDVAYTDLRLTQVAADFVAVYDQLGSEALREQALVDAFVPDWKGDLWLGAPAGARRRGGLGMWFSDSDEPLGLLLTAEDSTLLRGEGRWFSLPKATPLLACVSVIEVDQHFVRVYDEHERRDRHTKISIELAESMPPAPRSASFAGIDVTFGLIPDNAEWLLVDTNDGWTFQAGATRIVPAATDHERDLLIAPDAVEERIAYAHRAGVPLSFPEAAGTPLNELEGVPWLISVDNGDWTENARDVVLVRATGQGEFDNTEEGCSLARAYVDGRGQVPRWSAEDPRRGTLG
ncbi:MAG: hypothetical protein NTX33_18065 [Propionibacteriales bacterium]|nr:hypothetical protein [Propionibacteriales bacterium]